MTANYVITPVNGTLTINPIAVTVTADDKSFTYNGTAQSWSDYKVEGLVGNDAITAVVTGSITFPSESPVTNQLTSYEFISGTPGNYSVTTVNGELTMTTASQAITITAASEGWNYDGTAHTNTTVTVTDGELFTGDALVASASGSVTNVSETSEGNNPVASGYKVMHGEEDVTANYVITPVNGTLTITKNQNPLTVASDTKDWDYDAETHTYKVYKVTFGDEVIQGSEGQTEFTLSTDDKITITPIGKGADGVKNVRDSGDNSFTWTVENEDCYTKGDDVVGTLSINPINVTVTIIGNSGTLVYNGTEQSVSGYKVTNISNTLYVESDFTFTGTAEAKGTDAGITYYMHLAANLFNNTNNNFSVVTFDVTDGSLTITPKMSVYDFLTVEESGSSTVVSINGDIPSTLTNELSTSVEATEVTYTRTFNTPYATICLPFAVSASEAAAAGKFYQFTKITDNYEVVMTEVTDDLAANTPYIIAPASTNDKVSFSYTGAVTISPAVEPSTSDADDADWAFKGTYKVKSFKNVDPDDKAIYFFASTDQKDDEENVEIHAGDFVITDTQDDATKAAPFRAYLEYTGDGNLSLSSSSATGRDASASIMPRTLKVIIVNGDGTITKIGSISVSGEDKWFTIDGIQIEGQPTEGGMYIRNGRAVMVK